MPGQDFDVFISYSAPDQVIAAGLAERLKEAGLEPWFDQWYNESESVTGLRSSHAYLVLVGSAGLDEDRRPELELALERAARDLSFSLFARQNLFRLVLLLLPGLPTSFEMAELPTVLRSCPSLDVSNNLVDAPAAFEQLVQLLKEPPPASTFEEEEESEPAPQVSAVTPLKLTETSVLTGASNQAAASSLPPAKLNLVKGKGRLSAMIVLLAGLLVVVIMLQLVLLTTTSPQTTSSPSPQTLATLTAQAQALEKERASSEQNLKLSLSRELAAKALLQSQTDSELALLLALEANKTAHTEEAESALRQVLSLPVPRLTIPTASVQLNQVVFSSDGTLLATTGSGSYTSQDDKKEVVAQVWEVSTGKEVSKVIEDNSSAWQLSFSPDSKLLLLSNYYHSVKLVEAKTGKVVRELTEIKAPDVLSGSTFSPDGKLLLTSYRNAPTKIWETETGKLIANDIVGEQPVFSPDSHKVATINASILRVWDLATGKELAKLDPSTLISTKGKAVQLTTAKWSPDGTTLLVAGEDGFACLWAWSTSNTITFRNFAAGVWVNSVGFSSDGKSALISGDQGYLIKVDTTNGQQLGFLYSASDYFGLDGSRWSLDGHWAVSSNDQQQVRLWDLTNLSWSGSSYLELRVPGGISTVSFSPNSQLVATGGRDGKLRLWSLDFGSKWVEVGRTGSTAYLPVQLSPDGKLALKIDANQALIYDRASGQKLTSLNQKDFIRGATFSPDSRKVVTSGDNNISAWLWEARSGKLIAELPGLGEPVGFVAFSPDNKLVATVSNNTTLRLWEVANPNKPLAQIGTSGLLSRVAFSPDGKLLALPVSRTLYLYDTATQHERFKLEHPDFINSVSFSPDGTRLLSTSAKSALVYDLTTGQNSLTLSRHQDKVTYATFSPDGNLIATVEPNAIHLWQASTGKLLGDIGGSFVSSSEVSTSVAFSPDNKLVLVAFSNGQAQLWEIASLKKLEEVAVPNASGLTGNASVAFSPDGKIFVVSAPTGQARVYDCKLCGSEEELLNLAQLRLTRPLTQEERQQFLHDLSLNH